MALAAYLSKVSGKAEPINNKKNDNFTLPHRVTGHLGSGYFGQVKQGVWISGDKEIDVAMKTLNKQVVRDEDQIKFLQEAAIMAQFRHPNIVTLYGITYKEEPVSLVIKN